MQSLLLTLNTWLPSFLNPSGAKLDDVHNPNISRLFKILDENKSSQIPQQALQEGIHIHNLVFSNYLLVLHNHPKIELHGPKVLKRKLSVLSENEDETISVSDSGSYWHTDDDDDIFIFKTYFATNQPTDELVG